MIGTKWKEEILKKERNKKVRRTTATKLKDQFVKEYAEKAKSSFNKPKRSVSFPKQSNVSVTRTPRVRTGLGKKPIRL